MRYLKIHITDVKDGCLLIFPVPPKKKFRDRTDCVKHKILRIEISTADSDQPAVRLECNVSVKYF